MGKYVLFSPIGTTDPIANYRDGAMLHICRKYRPEKVYMYLSQEMLELQDMDDRYRYCVARLSSQIGHSIEIEEIRKNGLTAVHKFDDFYWEFESELKHISQQYPEHRIIINLSSGTPAMKAALQIISALADGKYLAVQVSTPENSSNPKRDDIKKYEVATEWECNEDNSEPKDRATELENLNLIARFKKAMIIKHIDVYDYHAAFSIAMDIKEYLSGKGYRLLEAANCRFQLNAAGIQKALFGAETEIIPMKQSDERNVFEFLLWLQIKQKRGDYSDFIRGLTPLVLDLFENILSKQCKINIRNYCEVKNKDGIETYRLTRKKLGETSDGQALLKVLDKNFNGGFKGGIFSSAHIAPLIESYHKDKSLIKDVLKIHDVEEKARNLAAHEIVSVTEDWIQKRCNISSEGIMRLLKRLAMKSGMNIREEYWNSYDSMNEIIKASL